MDWRYWFFVSAGKYAFFIFERDRFIMKSDRLYALTLYLLNHGRTPASKLAKHFEVSVRTIQRDMDTLCQAGIPIYAVGGINGGYAIMDTFQMNSQMISHDDFAYILTALRGLKTVTNSRQASDIFEKITAISNQADTGMILDFSVLQEGGEELLQTLQSAVVNQKTVKFSYTSNNGKTGMYCMEPVAVIYKWYAWYMLAYNKEKDDYRTYKLVRMADVSITEESFTKKHESAENIMKQCDNSYKNKVLPTKVKLLCSNNAVHRIREYLNGKVVETYEDGSAVLEIQIVENEQWWIGVVLSQGKDVKVLEPEHIKERIIAFAKDILLLYHKI